MTVQLDASVIVTAENQFTPWLTSGNGGATVQVTGTFTANIVLQIRAPKQPDGTDWALDTDGVQTVATYTAATDPSSASVTSNTMHGDWQWRLGCATGGYTNGTANCRLAIRNAHSL